MKPHLAQGGTSVFFKAEVWTSDQSALTRNLRLPTPSSLHLSWISCCHVLKTLHLIYFFSLFICMSASQLCRSISLLNPVARRRKGGVQASGFFLSLTTLHLDKPLVCSWARCCQRGRSSGKSAFPHPSFARLCVWTSRYFSCIASSAAASLLRPFFLSIYLHGGSSRMLGLSTNKPTASPYFCSIV